MSKNKKINFHLQLNPEDHKRIKDAAKKERRSLANFVLTRVLKSIEDDSVL